MYTYISCAYSCKLCIFLCRVLANRGFGHIRKLYRRSDVNSLMLCRHWRQAMLLSHTKRVVGRPASGETGNSIFRTISRQFVTFENIIISGVHACLRSLIRISERKCGFRWNKSLCFEECHQGSASKTKSDHAGNIERLPIVFVYKSPPLSSTTASGRRMSTPNRRMNQFIEH